MYVPTPSSLTQMPSDSQKALKNMIRLIRFAKMHAFLIRPCVCVCVCVCVCILPGVVAGVVGAGVVGACVVKHSSSAAQEGGRRIS